MLNVGGWVGGMADGCECGCAYGCMSESERPRVCAGGRVCVRVGGWVCVCVRACREREICKLGEREREEERCVCMCVWLRGRQRGDTEKEKEPNIRRFLSLSTPCP